MIVITIGSRKGVKGAVPSNFTGIPLECNFTTHMCILMTLFMKIKNIYTLVHVLYFSTYAINVFKLNWSALVTFLSHTLYNQAWFLSWA